MPIAPRRICKCGALTDCAPCRACRKAADQARGSAAARGYDRQWRKFEAEYLARHPICECTRKCGQPAKVAHHLWPLRDGGPKYDETYMQPLTEQCHNALRGAGGRA